MHTATICLEQHSGLKVDDDNDDDSTNRLVFSQFYILQMALETIQHHGYTTYTAHAIQKAILVDLQSSQRFTSTCTKKAIVVVTDGR